jgi:hypothetical protein
MTRRVTARITINAGPNEVWEVLTQFEKFSLWNPFIRQIQGRLEPGSKLKMSLSVRSGRTISLRPTLLRVDPHRELRWRGHLWVPGLVDGEHAFHIETIQESKVRFIQQESFGGLLVPFIWWSLKEDARRGFEDMNQAIKKRAEGKR